MSIFLDFLIYIKLYNKMIELYNYMYCLLLYKFLNFYYIPFHKNNNGMHFLIFFINFLIKYCIIIYNILAVKTGINYYYLEK